MKTLLLSLLMLASTTVTATVVNLEVSNLAKKKGSLFIAVFNDPGQFPDKTPVQTRIVPVNRQDVMEVVLNLPEGDYAISMFLDENGNNKLDANFLGIPKERFGFSNNPRILTGPPSYQQCEVRISGAAKSVKIKLIKFL